MTEDRKTTPIPLLSLSKSGSKTGNTGHLGEEYANAD